jgi:uncharacterized membrane protein
MDRGEYRFESLERRVRHLEQRLARLEAQGTAPSDAQPARPVEPHAVPAAPEPPPMPAPIAAATLHAAGGRVSLPAPAAWPTGVAAARSPSRQPPPGFSRQAGWGTPRAWPAAEATTPPTPAPSTSPSEAWSEPVVGAPISLKDLEERFAGRALAWIGGVALVAAAIFFLSLAFSRGWITEPMRVLIGLTAGSVAFATGAVLLSRKNPLVGNVLAGVGLGIVSVSLFAATRLYGLLPPEAGLAGALVAAIAAAAVAVRYDARSVAAFGLVAALIAPPLMGASPTLLTLLFVAVTLAGSTAVSLFRSWRWLPSLAFVLAAPQLASWVAGDPDTTQAVVALTGFWLVNIVAAAGEEVRIRRDDLRPSSATLVLANAAFLLWGIFVVTDGSLDAWRGFAIALASLAHLLVGGWFLYRQGWEHLFGNLVAGTGVALLAIAAFVQLGAPAVPVAWAAEAVALAWLAVRRRHPWSAGAALILGGLAITHLVVVEYPLWEAGIPAAMTFDPPLLNPEGGSLLAVLLAFAVTVGLVPVRWIRSVLVGVGVLLVAYAATFSATGPALAAALVMTGLAGLLLDRLVDRLPTADGLEPVAGWTTFGWSASAAAVVPGLMAVVLLFSTEFPPQDVGILATSPFLNPAFVSLVVVVAGLVAAGILVRVRWLCSGFAGLGIVLLAWALAFQVTGVDLVALLAVLLPAGVVIDRGLARLPDDERFAAMSGLVTFELSATAGGAVAWTAAALYAIATFLDPTGWGRITPPSPPFSDERALVAALLAGAALAAARWLAPMALRRAAVIAAIVAAAWVVPFEVYADMVVVLWVALAAAALATTRWDGRGGIAYAGLGSILWIGGAGVAFGIVARPDRLWVVDTSVEARAPLLALWPLAFVSLAVLAYLAPRHPVFAGWRAWLEVTSGTLLVYAVSIAVVDLFQRQVGGSTAVEELAKQAQTALTVTWTLIGAAALAVGLVRHRPMLRHAGFALLGLAIAKVVLIDMAAMDVAYRALVLAGVGLLLLVSAYLWTHFRGPRSGVTGITGGPHPAG